MKIEVIAANKYDNPHRMAGSYDAALRITIGDLVGVGSFHYEFDKRDVMAERLSVEPRIEEAVREALPEEGPSVMNGIFVSDTTGDQNKVTEAASLATALVYDYDG